MPNFYNKMPVDDNDNVNSHCSTTHCLGGVSTPEESPLGTTLSSSFKRKREIPTPSANVASQVDTPPQPANNCDIADSHPRQYRHRESSVNNKFVAPVLAPKRKREAATPSANQAARVDTPLPPATLKMGSFGQSPRNWTELCIRKRPSTQIGGKKDTNPASKGEKQTLAKIAALGLGELDTKVQEDPNAWRKKVRLSTVECELKYVELAVPDFPFHQSQLRAGSDFQLIPRKGGKHKRNMATINKKISSTDSEASGTSQPASPASPFETPLVAWALTRRL